MNASIVIGLIAISVVIMLLVVAAMPQGKMRWLMRSMRS
jgi:hypothetical protein